MFQSLYLSNPLIYAYLFIAAFNAQAKTNHFLCHSYLSHVLQIMLLQNTVILSQYMYANEGLISYLLCREESCCLRAFPTAPPSTGVYRASVPRAQK